MGSPKFNSKPKSLQSVNDEILDDLREYAWAIDSLKRTIVKNRNRIGPDLIEAINSLISNGKLMVDDVSKRIELGEI